MDKPASIVCDESDAFGIVEISKGWTELLDAFSGIFVAMSVKDPSLDPVEQAFIGEIDTELIQRVGPYGTWREILSSWEVEESDEC
jgi:hypothetical protein